MNSLLIALGSITMLFILFLIGKTIFKKEFCALCAAVSVTWVVLLVLYFTGQFFDRILIAILLGQTILGIFYLAEKKVPSTMTVFRLPFLITLTTLGYFLLSTSTEYWITLLFILFLWIIFFFLYFYKNNPSLHKTVKKIIDCCKRW